MKTTQLISRSSRAFLRRASVVRPSLSRPARPTSHGPRPISIARPFTSTSHAYKGLQPDTSDPKAPDNGPTDVSPVNLQPASLSDAEYHEIADQYMNALSLALEEKAEDLSAGFEAEFSAGVLNVTTPQGSFVINKQPPNRQIWLSSPISGPKRFDWVTAGSGQNQKQETETEQGDDGTLGGGKWIYIRDGTNLTDLLKSEVGVEMSKPRESDVTLGREGPGESIS